MNAALQTPCRAGPVRTCQPRPAPAPISRAAPTWSPLIRGPGPLAELMAGAIAVGALVAGPWLG